DGVNAAIAHEALDRNGVVAASFEGVGGFVAAATPNLHRVIDDLPGDLRAPEFAHGGFQTDIGLLIAINEAGGVKGHRLHGESVRGHASDFVGDGGVFANGS